jgi:hypothetical protein
MICYYARLPRSNVRQAHVTLRGCACNHFQWNILLVLNKNTPVDTVSALSLNPVPAGFGDLHDPGIIQRNQTQDVISYQDDQRPESQCEVDEKG